MCTDYILPMIFIFCQFLFVFILWCISATLLIIVYQYYNWFCAKLSVGDDIYHLPILLELLSVSWLVLLWNITKSLRIHGKFCKLRSLLNEVANVKQTCRFLLPLGFCTRFSQVLHCSVSDCCSKQQKLESWILYKNWYERLFVVNFFFNASLEMEWLQ